MNLGELFNRYGTDKDLIGYTRVYEGLFAQRRREIRSFLEVGIGTLLPGLHSSMHGFALEGYRPGGSLRAWRDYFPGSVVHGMDVAPDTQFREQRITTHLCDSTVAADVRKVFAGLGSLEFDVVVDDGSHVDTDQLETLANLYPHVREGGFYVIEDVHVESVFRRDPEILRARCGADPLFFAAEGTTICVIQKSRSGSAAGAILMYHRVNELAADPHGLCVSPAAFRDQMRYLAEHHPVVALAELARGARDGSIPERAVAVTFDDGTLDALEAASPILTDLGIPATFFVNVERVDEEHEPWWDVVARIVLAGDVPEPRESYAALHRTLMHASRAERERAIAELVDRSGRPLPARRSHRLLLPNEIRELAERPGHAIGAHSVSHVRLPMQPEAERDWEIGASRRELERITGRPVTLFSYPYGGCDRDTAERVRRAGFRAAVTTEPGTVTLGTDVHALPRLEVKGGDVSELADALGRAFAGVAPT